MTLSWTLLQGTKSFVVLEEVNGPQKRLFSKMTTINIDCVTLAEYTTSKQNSVAK